MKNNSNLSKIISIGLAVVIFGTFLITATPSQPSGISVDVANSYESVITSPNGWTCTAGGRPADTHFARVRFTVEQFGRPFTKFYTKAVVVLPNDFYSKQTAAFRILATDNWKTSISGVTYGSVDGNDLRVGLSIYRDHLMYLLVDHYPGQKIVLWKSSSPLSTGRHTIEIYGDVSVSSEWFLKIDGITLASGVAMLATTDTPVSERLITRFVSCIDGAADLDNNSMSVVLESFQIADYLPWLNVASPTVFPIVTKETPTITVSPSPTLRLTDTPTPTVVSTGVPTLCESSEHFKICYIP